MYEFDRLLQTWVGAKQIPGAVLDISIGRSFRFQQAYGSYASDSGQSRPIQLNTIFDLASLTKVAATLPSVLKLVSDGSLRLEDSVSHYLPEFQHPMITVRHLLQHTSGLPAGLGRDALERTSDMGDVIYEISKKKLLTEPGQTVLYSDLSMILLGLVVEQISGERLNDFAQQHVFAPLGMVDAGFCPAKELQSRIAATEWHESGYLHGQVHDGTCRYLGGVCGHAGLFAAADDLQRYAGSWLYPSSGLTWLNEELVQRSVSNPYQGRGLGWEVYDGTAASPLSRRFSCGSLFSTGSFGHTGFTGTSLWVDPAKELTVVFLTNVVHFGRKHELPSLRPVLHDAIVRSLDLA